MHNTAFAMHERHQILHIGDHLGALRMSDHIGRGPGRHGVQRLLPLPASPRRSPHRDLHTRDYYTGNPNNQTRPWDVHDKQRRDW